MVKYIVSTLAFCCLAMQGFTQHHGGGGGGGGAPHGQKQAQPQRQEHREAERREPERKGPERREPEHRERGGREWGGRDWGGYGYPYYGYSVAPVQQWQLVSPGCYYLYSGNIVVACWFSDSDAYFPFTGYAWGPSQIPPWGRRLWR
jgi:hypothetical protein